MRSCECVPLALVASKEKERQLLVTAKIYMPLQYLQDYLGMLAIVFHRHYSWVRLFSLIAFLFWEFTQHFPVLVPTEGPLCHIQFAFSES